MQDIKEHVIKVVKDAGEYLLDMQDSELRIDYKEGNSPVTNIDKESEDKIIKALERYNFNIVSEETEIVNKRSEHTWFIDPLDGTETYIEGGESFGISIGLAKNNKIIFGAVYFPKKDKLYAAEKGKGVFMNEKRIKVSSQNLYSKSNLVISPSNYKKETVRKLIESMRLSPNYERSFANKICLVAEGKMDATLYMPQHKWDIAASDLILEEAGGKLTNFNGEEIIYDLSNPEIGGVLATNSKLHKEYLQRIESFFSKEKL